MRTEADNFLNMLRKEIGESIVDSRRQKRITQRELAAMCGISERMLRLVENGERRYGLDIYLLLSAALELPSEALLAESVGRIRQTAEGRERMDRQLRGTQCLMRKRLEGYRREKKSAARAKAVGHRRQDTGTKA